MTKLPAWTKKMPKKVTICGRTFKIVYNMRRGALFSFDDAKITIGCVEPRDEIVDSLIHEISEAAHVLLGYRFHNGGEGCEMIFHMDHAKFQNHNIMLVAALKDCGLLK